MIDYGAGNVQSVQFALERLGYHAELSDQPERIARADRVIFPGVGAAKASMEQLRLRGLDSLIPTLQQPVLGICVGMQVMATHSEEDNTPCLGIIDARVRRFPLAPGSTDKVPHMGWNTLRGVTDWLPADLEAQRVYYVHSYAMEPNLATCALTEYGGGNFSAAVRQGNFYGTQFHTEKSGKVGAQILKAFLEA